MVLKFKKKVPPTAIQEDDAAVAAAEGADMRAAVVDAAAGPSGIVY